MDLEYDRKFEEMKKYIPFLESMIKRLENSSSCSNPRQAQLDKIRSLRDLLMDKKKRMKMENLLKCEQVLVNLYAKVEQRDSLPGPKMDDSSKKPSLNVVRNKLKSVVSKLQQEPVETLPEIARASDTEEICVPGSKEPALFQRRPNVPSITASHLSPNKDPSMSNRNYTRVLLSPESVEKHWSNEVSTSEKPLFSRRSPKKSPHKRSPSYYKKERKKSSKNKLKLIQSKDLNITLNVPEDSLNSLNTKDILSRIINCSDSDVDIATLRELRTQILGELKETGANDDISDIILKSYKKKGNGSKTNEVEEGELSDSESEAIESIYGSLVVLDKNKPGSTGNKSCDKEKPRKIQICLVINSDKTKSISNEEKDNISCMDTSDFETFNHKDEKVNDKLRLDSISPVSSEENYNEKTDISQESFAKKVDHHTDKVGDSTSENPENEHIGKNAQKINENVSKCLNIENNLNDDNDSAKSVKVANKSMSNEPVIVSNQVEIESQDKLENFFKSNPLDSNIIADSCIVENDSNIKIDVDIPLLEPTKQVSEIDILQALKKEILSETSNVLNIDTTLSELTTPLLHQPKITKVVNAQEIGSKKRISIESYKAKSIPCVSRLSSDKINNTFKDDVAKKQSLKLTEKECERFNFLSKLTLTESSDDEDKSIMSVDDIYTDLAPKSPDHEDFADTGLKPPVIIPSDPVQTAIISSENDVDMRKLLPNNKCNESTLELTLSPKNIEKSKALNSDKEISRNNERVGMQIADPRIKRDNSGSVHDGTNQHSLTIDMSQRSISNFVTPTPVMHNINVDMTPALNMNSNINLMIPSLQSLNMTPNVSLNMSPNVTQTVTSNIVCPLIPNMTPNRIQNNAPNMTPNIPILMTPNRTPNIVPNMTPNMTPSRHTFDNDDYSSRKHVYAPMFPVFEQQDAIEKPRENLETQWDTSESRSSIWDDQNTKISIQRDIDYREPKNCAIKNDTDYRDHISSSLQNDIDYRDPRSQSIQRDIDYRNIRNNSVQGNQTFDIRESDRIQFPTTPSHPFGRLDCNPTTPPVFGMLEMPMTPVHPFGRSDCPLTPIHPFGRVESLLPTPPLFIRSDYNNQTVARPQDPRLNRNSDHDDRERNYFNERKFNSASYNNDQTSSHNNSELYRRYNHEQSVGRNERNKKYDAIGRNYRDHTSRRETSIGRSFNREDRDISRNFNREYEGDRYSRNRSNSGRGYDYRHHKDSKNYDEGSRRSSYRRERSVGRMQETFSNKNKDSNRCSKLNVQPHGGNSFTIDTSIKSTFQERNTRQKSTFSFDARRQRASSVGRSLLPDKNKTSDHETELASNEIEKKIDNVKNFRRACSVGREVEDNKRDFKDIKADLKSFKLKSDLRFSKQSITSDKSVCRVLPECIKSYNLRDSKKEVYDKYHSDSKYSPRRNNRDPRMRREYIRDNKDYNSRDSKTYGIVYSNDNISKGRILGSGYGVKNYKIPKIKRPQESLNIKQKDDKIDSQNEVKDIEDTFDESNDSTVSKSCKTKDIQNFKNNEKKDERHIQEKGELLRSTQKYANNEYSDTEKSDYEVSVPEKQCTVPIKNRKSTKLQIVKNNDMKEVSDNDDNTKEKKEIKMRSTDTISDVSLDNIEKRVTRSARKSMTEESKALEISPIKRPKKSKKSYVLDSDSDDNDNVTKAETSPFIKCEEASQDHSLITTLKNEILCIQSSSEEVTKDKRVVKQVDENLKEVSDGHNILSIEIKDKPLTTVLESSKQEVLDLKNTILEHTKTEKQVLDTDMKSALDLQSNLRKENEKGSADDLDSSFGIGDLEMFSDNITSDPVIDNINALIADLDHDLNSSKTIEANSHFTKELSLETMLEKISNPDKNDKKAKINDGNHEQGLRNKSEEELKNAKPVISFGDHKEENAVEHSDDSLMLKLNSETRKSQTTETVQHLESTCSEVGIYHNVEDKLQGSEIGQARENKKCELSEEQNLEHGVNICVKRHVQVIKGDIDDSCSNEAVVSTSQDGDIYKPESTFKSLIDGPPNTSSTPDSTINSNENIDDVELKSALPITNDSSCEMNSDITSTHVSDVTSKDLLQALPSDARTSTQIESIGKLLSILQDKTKIKELLSVLGDQSSENEKIIKKLEKLSEIVSDDEPTVERNNVTDTSEAINPKVNVSEADFNKNVLHDNDEHQDVNDKKYEKKQEINYEKPEVQISDKCLNTNNSQSKENICNRSNEDNTSNFSSKHQDEQEENHTKSDEIKNEDSEELRRDTNDVKNSHSKENIFSTNNKDSSNLQNTSQEKIATETVLKSEESKIQEYNKCEDMNQEDRDENSTAKKNATKQRKRRGKKRNGKKKKTAVEDRRLTRSDAVNFQQMTCLDKQTAKKPSRELQKLQEDLKEMFLKDDISSATGIRMCRIAKLVDEKKPKDDVLHNESNSQEPLVVLKKYDFINEPEKNTNIDKVQKKKIPKHKSKIANMNNFINSENKSKDTNLNKSVTVSETDSNTKIKEKQSNLDPYDFETDSVNEPNNESNNENDSTSESESDSVGSIKSFESTELVETKKKVKRKRVKGWQAGIIKPKNRKKKLNQKPPTTTITTLADNNQDTQVRKVPDFTCFTDKTYCFRKNVTSYNCRICSYSGTDIVHHYKKEHPHTEVPLSRMCPGVAKEAIKESEDVNFQGISKISSKKYICRFCFKEFSRKKRLLETFFWHVVSMHTGEYKQTCSKCVNTQTCPLDIDIPPPPKDAKGQLLGYICEKCNYTQISLENLKTHVIVWHNDEQTAVYTVNLASLSKTAISYLLRRCVSSSVDIEQQRVLRSSRSNQSMAESSDDESDTSEESNGNWNDTVLKDKKVDENREDEPIVEKISNMQSKIVFESDVTDEIANFETSGSEIKEEPDANEIQDCQFNNSQLEPEKQVVNTEKTLEAKKPNELNIPKDIFDYPHFKIKYADSGCKEYMCCINGKDFHYKTTLLISLKKHVQLKHSENWDGYCCLCKVIVTPQGNYKFQDCLRHFLDKHMDNFPIFKDETQQLTPDIYESIVSKDAPETAPTNKSYINVRPLSQLISKLSEPQPTEDNIPALPIIESVISLGAPIDQPRPSPSYPTPVTDNVESVKEYKYEEFQADVMSRKHRVVLEAMMSHTKLVQVFKCAGRFCSFGTDSAENALLHASTHMRVGGIDSLNCVYCDFDSSGNAIDLITHVFKNHGCCPYVCGLCFYRATASQLVNAHIKRLHKSTTNVPILKTPFQTPAIQEDNALSRETAVPHYLCCDTSGPDGPCKYRTYTPAKFWEHLQTRHASASEYLCFICSKSFTAPADLIRHFKTHGFKLYQCAWCFFGADSEIELLDHASAVHPARQPKAYLRIITSKEGSSGFRVLPLAQMNKPELPVTEVVLNNLNHFPVREAERSIELEKLIGHTNFMIESMTTSVETGASQTEHNAPIDSDIQQEQSLLDNCNILETSVAQVPRTTTPIPPTDTPKQSDTQVTPIIKAETLELTPEKIPQSEPEIVCLDSDDESVSQNVSNLSDVGTPTMNLDVPAPIKIKKVRLAELFVCSKCKMILKFGSGFKVHIKSCFGSSDPIPCAHCSLLVFKKYIVTHYNSHCDKRKESVRYSCPNCILDFSNPALLKEHQLMKHNLTAAETAATIKEVASALRRRGKRSLESRDKAAEPPEKIKRYGPQDIDKLPINPILDDFVVCSLCEFNTKVRLNMVRHLQLHAQQQPVPQTAPVNPVPHLETNEKHFDKMVNLASSSIVTRLADKSNKADNNTSVTLSIPPEAIARYPKYVPDKQRLTCGAKGCSYISVDESILKCHWETLHYGTTDFHCVHCPPYQHLDTSKPLTASRILAHLKMHDERLYACSLCSYYHYRRPIVEKHLTEVHKGGQVMIVRESKVAESSTSAGVSTTQIKASAPTMDLKPWQCGLCKFKSLLRPEVVDHCAKIHNSKMQYKCAYCAFRTSNPENVTKHQAKSHISKPEEIFYYYYREGSVPDNPDGTTRWQKQCQNSVPSETKVKCEDPSEIPSQPTTQKILPPRRPVSSAVDLNLVKKETIEPIQDSIEDLCKEFGEFCEPNGLKYKCSLCSNVIEDSLEAMQSHLYEELKYRKWGCSICSYKAFHKEGLNEHMHTEHRQNRDPIALPIDNRVETWVAKLLEHQTALIGKYRENLAKQKVEILRVNPGPSTPKAQPQQARESSLINPPSVSTSNNPITPELEKIFGQFGVSINSSYCCPKCNSTFKEENVMRSHLESELNKIRWFCNKCFLNFQTYHEAQFHSKSAHVGQGARPVEVTRDITVRLAWIEAVIRVQKSSFDVAPLVSASNENSSKTDPISELPENSLLVVRYEKNIATPEEEMKEACITPTSVLDSDDEKLVIDEPLENRKTKPSHGCPHCNYSTITERTLRDHILKHYGLKAFTCPYCGLNGPRNSIEKHQKISHPTSPINLISTLIPKESPSEYSKLNSNTQLEAAKVVCLVCRSYFTETESQTHLHDKILTTFGKKGEVVVQCSVCLTLHKDVTGYLKHHKLFHPTLNVNYVFSKLNTISVESKGMLYACGICTQKFVNIKDLKSHADGNHKSLLKYILVPKINIPIIDLDEYEENEMKRKSDDDSILPPCKRTARKSTTKLPFSKQCARKSTTKLPFGVRDESMEFSFYGTKPSTEEYEDKVATMMPFCNKMVPFTFNRLREIININPVVMVDKMIINSIQKE